MTKPKYRATVMISSTTKDLLEHRQHVVRACGRLQLVPIIMEYYTAQFEPDANPISGSLRMVEEADIYIGILGMRYGSIIGKPDVNPDRLSVTELEYRHALKLGKPMLIYQMSDDHEGYLASSVYEESEEQREKLRQFKELAGERWIGRFDSAYHLETLVVQGLAELLRNGAIPDLDDSQEIKIAKVQRTMLPTPPQMYSVPGYGLTKRFFGRSEELKKLDDWGMSDDPVMVVEALGGMGKSAVTWEWTTQHAKNVMSPAGIVWWSFYEGGATIDGFMRHALAYIMQQDPDALKELSYEERAEQLLRALNSSPFLLVMDGFERILNAYHRIDGAYLRDEQVQEENDHRSCTEPRDGEFIRRLASITQSKILISSRLLPAEFEEYGTLLAGVQHIKLEGLSHDDAQRLFFDLGVKRERSSPTLLTEFFNHIGYHPLLLKITAGTIRKYPPASGDFDRWYQQRGMQTNMALMAKHDKRNHVLFYAFAGLSEAAKQVLCQIAAFSAQIDFQTLSIFNPFLPPPPPAPELPPLPQLRPSPFGSPRLAWLHQRYRTVQGEEKEQIAHEIEKQEQIETEQAAWMRQNQDELHRQLEKVRRERQRLVDEAEWNYQQSPAYIQGEDRFNRVLTELSERGLLSWDLDKDSYDLHPVVRGYALSLLAESEKRSTFGKIRDHFAPVPLPVSEAVSEVTDIFTAIELYRAVVNTGELDIAANYYFRNLSDLLGRLGANHLVIELLRPLFTAGLDRLPSIQEPIIRSYIVTYMARAMQRIGDAKNALQLFTLTLDPDVTGINVWSMSIALRDYAVVLLDYNEVARAGRAEELATLLTPPNNTAWSNYYNFRFAVLRGQWDEAEDYLQQAMNKPETRTQAKDWQGRMALYLALMHVYRDEDADTELQDALQLLEETRQRRFIGLLWEVWALYLFNRGEIRDALGAINEALKYGQQSGAPVAALMALLGRIYQALGDALNAQRWIEAALVQRQTTDGIKAELYMHVAYYYLAARDFEKAKEYAGRGYDFAWANGEPYSRWYPLNMLKKLYNQLGEAQPMLLREPSSQIEALPYEAEIITKYLRDGKLIMENEAKEQPPFEMTRATWFQVGTLATFGVDEDILMEMSRKIATLSDIPTPVQITHAGEEVPIPDQIEVVDEHRDLSELVISFDEQKYADKFFLICFIQSQNSSSEMVYAFVNIRFDRLGPLLENLNRDTPFNLSDYVTLVQTGVGELDEETREKMRRDYLFGEYITNVRVFPPLEEATKGNIPAASSTPQAPYIEMTKLTNFQIGALAVFGIEDEELISGIAYKLTRLSVQPKLPVLSKMGEEVPLCPEEAPPVDWTQLPLHQLLFSNEETSVLIKVFAIVYVESTNQQGDPVYAYINVRFDRLANLFRISDEGMPFNLSMYATLVQNGEGQADQEVREKLARDYLFGEECLNVRIFPPLEDVT